jgi:hypothetical protein
MKVILNPSLTLILEFLMNQLKLAFSQTSVKTKVQNMKAKKTSKIDTRIENIFKNFQDFKYD